MLDISLKKYEKQDIIIFSAAVSDYKSTIIHDEKNKEKK